ncbi:MAG TPA: MFS transporter [Polyangiaceae bacterium]
MPADPSAKAAWAVAPGILLAGVAGGIAFPILPVFGARAGLSLAFIGVVLAANRATRVVANPIVGMIADRFGGRRTLLVGLLVQIVVMALFWLGVTTKHTGFFFLAGRIVHGPGSSCVFVAGQALALHSAGPKKGGQAGGIVRAAMQIGVPVGLVLGGVLADTIGEARTFEAAAGALLLATIGAYVLVPDLRVTMKGRPALFRSLAILGDKRLAAIGSLNFAATFAGSGLVLTTATLLVQARHLAIGHFPERASASMFMGLLVISEGVSMPFLGRLGDRKAAHAWVAAVGMTFMIPALLVIAGAKTPVVYALGLALLGTSVGALGPSVLALIGDLVEPHLRGLAVGAIQVCADVGGAAGPLFGTTFFATSIALPYEVSALVIASFVPAAFWLTRARPQVAVVSRAP